MVTPFICLWGRYYLPHPCPSFMELGGSLTNSAGILKKKDLYVYEKIMVDSLKLFNSNEFGGMRTYRDPNTGDVWFCLADVCKALDLMNPRKVKTTLTERGLILLNMRDLDNTVTNSYGTPAKDLGGNPNMTFIDEGNLYQVIFQSRKPKKKRIRDCKK